MPKKITSNGLNRRRTILEVATQLFAQDGYSATGMDDIGAGAGISGPAIYRHFPNKSSILVAIFQETFEARSTGGREIVERDDPPEVLLRALIEFHIAFTLGRQGPFPYYEDQQYLPAGAKRRIEALDLGYRDDWLRVLSKTRKDDPFEVLRTITSSVFGLVSQGARNDAVPRVILEPLLVGMAWATAMAKPMPRGSPSRRRK
jgi:AcrR family transcriptional regulator